MPILSLILLTVSIALHVTLCALFIERGVDEVLAPRLEEDVGSHRNADRFILCWPAQQP